MKLAVSNLAWPPADEPAVASALDDLAVTGVEIAPTVLWPRPLEAAASELDRCRRTWASRGIGIVAIQSLLFGRPDLTIFEAAETRRATLDYLTGMIRVAAALGARVLVFGSPGNRRVGQLPREEAGMIAEDFFRSVGEAAAAHGVIFAIEPNPPEYGCDFVTTSAEGAALVRAVDHPGFGLHLDSGGLTLAAEPLDERLSACADLVRHFHVSEVNLALIGTGSVAHDEIGAALRRVHYDGWISIEMKAAPGEESAARVRRAVSAARAAYRVAG